MKRLLLRISALGTVIALGLIAIAQAQRSTGPITSPVPAAQPTSNLPADTGERVQNPLRAQGSQQASVSDVVNSLGSRPGIPAGDEPMPLRPAEDFSLSAATQTGMMPLTDNAVPVVPEFGGPAVSPQATQDLVSQSQSMPIEPLGSAAPPAQSLLGPAPASIVANPTVANASPTLAGPASSPGIPTPANGSFPSSAPLGVASGTLPVVSNTVPMGAPPTDASFIPQTFAEPEAQPMSHPSAPSTFANSPIQADAFPGPQMATGSGRPGVKDLEGAQAPQLVVEKIAPAEIQVGRPAIFEIHVRNIGAVAASMVEIRDEIPRNTRLQSTKPQASQGTQGDLVWKIGTLNPNEDVTVEMELMPTDEGEIGSVATVHFQTEASVRTRATRPLLAIEADAVEKVLKGEEVTLKITVSNPGSGVAENVVLEEHVPPGFRHPAGAELEYEVGNLAPGESRELNLTLEAVHPGPLVNVITVRGEPNLRIENQRPIEVVAPQLAVAVEGPARRYLEREAVYNLSVRNPGTAPAKQVELAVEVPAGMKFVSGTNRAYYEETTRTVHWMLEEIPVQDGPPPVQLTLMPVEAGQHKIRLVSSDDSGAKAEVEQAVYVEGLVAIYFEVADLQDPIEVNGETSYEIRVVNQGSKEATNVQLVAEMPPGLLAIAAEGQTQYAAQGNRIMFEPLPRLAPKADVTYRIRARGVQPGDLRVKVQVTTDEIQTPVTKEESTRVYSDQ